MTNEVHFTYRKIPGVIWREGDNVYFNHDNFGNIPLSAIVSADDDLQKIINDAKEKMGIN